MSSGSDFAHRASFPYLSGLHVGNRCVGEDMLTLHNTILSQKNPLSSNYFPGFMQRMCRRRNCRCQTSDYVVIWQSAGGKCRRREEQQKPDGRIAKDSEERTRTCAERWESREGLCLSNQWMLRTGESKSRLAKAAGRRALWRDERGKRARCCGAKQR